MHRSLAAGPRLVLRRLTVFTALAALAGACSDDAPATAPTISATDACYDRCTVLSECLPQLYTASEAQRCRKGCEGDTVPAGCEADEDLAKALGACTAEVCQESGTRGACGDAAPAGDARARCARPDAGPSATQDAAR